MRNLRININGKFYDISCDKNNEKYVLELTKRFNAKVQEISLRFAGCNYLFCVG